MAAQSALGSPTWRPQALQDANLADQSWSKSPTWRSKSLPRAFRRLSNGFPRAFQDLPDSEKPCSHAGESLTFMFLQHWLCTRRFGSSWSVFGASWALLGGSWAPLGLNLGALGANLGETWALLGPTWGQPGRPRDHLGRSWGQLGRTLGYMDLPKLLLGCSWRLLGASWRPQGAVLTVQSGLSNSTWRSKAFRGANSGGLELSQRPLGGTKHVRNNLPTIRATRSKSIDR